VKCKICQNNIFDEQKVCINCGNKIEEESNRKNNFLLKNSGIHLMSIINFLLFFIGIIVSMYSEGEWTILLSPIIAGVMNVPQYIGVGLSSINKKVNSYVITIFILITSLLSLCSIIYCYYEVKGISGIMFWVTLLQCISLIIGLLLKLILKVQE